MIPTGGTALTAEGNSGDRMSVTCEETQNAPTPRIQCHGKAEAEKLERLLEKVRRGNPIKQIIRFGSVVYVHLEDENIG